MIKIQKVKKNNYFNNVINFLFFKITFKEKYKNCVAIVDPGGIGDYILHRKYFKFFKESPEYKNKKLIFFGRKMYLNMFKNYDSDVFFDVIAYDSTDKKELKKEISKYKFDTLIHLQTMCNAIAYPHAKNERIDFIKKFRAKNKIVNVIKNHFYNDKNEKYLKTIYNKIIFTEEELFENERLRILYEKLLNIKIPHQNNELKPIIDFSKEYACISLASVGDNRNYNADSWAKIINFIIRNNSSLNLVILGSHREEDEINNVLSKINKTERIINLTTLIDITIVPAILKNAKFLLSIETGTVHIAQSVGCKSICLSSGGFYGRFLPYHNNLTEYIFPDEFDNVLNSHDKNLISSFYDYERTFKTSDINPDKVINVLKKYI